MKAVLFRRHGGPEVLEYTDYPSPVPAEDQVLIRLRAAGLNRMDLAVRKGWPGIKIEFPHIGGADGAGEVVARGRRATEFNIGDHVAINANLGCGKCEYCQSGWDNLCRDWHLLGETVRGTYAEYVALPERQLFRLPLDFDFQAAAAAALVYQTAWHALITRAELRPGETVLVVGASGGVNTAAIQVAKLAGAVVFVVGSTPAKLVLAQSLGADELIDRSKDEDWSKSAFLRSGRKGMDVVFDNVGTTLMSSLRALRKGGRLVTVGSSGGPKAELDHRYVFYRNTSIVGSTMSHLRDFRTVMDLVVKGRLRPVLDRTFPLRDAALAQSRLEAGDQLGKITLDIG